LGEKTNWLDSDDLEMLYRGPFVTDFYRVLHHRVHQEYRARKAWRNVTAALKKPTTLRPAHLRQAISIPINPARLVKSTTQLRRLAKVPPDDPVTLELQSA
jgi:anaerobic magnesium-protoporphyrin IX monomethyl ester cyclase